ncbi:MAG: hypothetical protein A2X64_01080 [Ignavibacteria bacterium GWF2_33_9]|nr:MAG: hypothetical protein A2X64_01080 [Ignavibacteria bacterium GWF2_33_9]
MLYIFLISIIFISCSKKENEPEDFLKVNELMEKAEQINEDFKSAEDKFEARKAAGDTLAIEWMKLYELIPDVDGFTRSEPKGMMFSMENLAYSNATATFQKDNLEIEVSLYDYNQVVSLFAAATAWKNVGFNVEDENGYQKVSQLKEITDSWIFEEWRKNNKRATVTISLNDRFFLQVSANDQPGTEFVKSIAMKVINKGKSIFNK